MKIKTAKKDLQSYPLKGEFTVKNPEQRVTKKNTTYMIFEINAGLLPVQAIAWNDSCQGLSKLWHGQTVWLTGQWELFYGQRQVRCLSLYKTHRQSQQIDQAKTRLRALLAWLPNNSLKGFLGRVLNDPAIAQGFISAPASVNHHHAFPGGLLVHSVDVAWQIFSQQRIAEKERYLGAVVGLFHDLGKIRTLLENGSRSELGVFVGHEQLTLEILSPHLSWLDKQDQQIAVAIRYLLSWKPKGLDRLPKLDINEYIRAADRVSAGSSCPWAYK